MLNQDRNAYFILFSLWLLVFSASSQVMIIAPLFPLIIVELDTSESLMGNLVMVYAIMIGIFAIAMGPVSDKIGRRKILLLGSFLMSIFLFLHSFVESFGHLLILRALTGGAGGILSGAAVSYVGDYFPYNKRGWANGWVMSGVAMGQILGIPLGTFLADLYGFKFPFLLFAIIMGLTYLLIFFKVPQPDVEFQNDEITLKNSLIKYGELLRRKEILSVSISYLLMFFSLSIYIIYMPVWLTNTFNVSVTEIGILFLIGGVMNALAGPLAGKISDKTGRKSMILVSCIGLGTLMFFTTILIKEFWVTYIYFPIAMTFIALRISPFQALTSELVRSNNRGSLMSMLVAIGNVGTGLAGLLSGIFFTMFGFISNTVLGTVSIIITAFIVWKLVPEPDLKVESIQKSVELAE
tara:strand:+ start:195190 stop:196416 length:1227 start_codon:yes stop_codon:yes gene_type:complete